MSNISMLRISSLLAIVLFAAAGFADDSSPIGGKWNCVSTDEKGTEISFTLKVQDEGGKLSGSIVILQSGDELPIVDPAFKEHVLTFKIQLNEEETVELTARVDGSKIEGKFQGKSSGSGSFKGSRQS